VEPQSNENEIRSTLDLWRDSAHLQAERPDWFWSRQRKRILSEIDRRQNRPPAFAWAGVAATVALGIALLIPSNQPNTGEVVTRTQVAQTELSDHDLMLAVERTLNAGVPTSLAPAGMLAQEMNQAFAENNQSQKSKETKYEN
jgi:hypothetical protein